MKKVAAALITALVILGFGIPDASARELREFYRGVRAMGMGNAFTAVADDADAVFYNPAGLGLGSRYELRLFNPKIDMSTDDLAVIGDLRNATAQFDAHALDAFYGKHIYGSASIFPSIRFPNFSVGYYMGAELEIIYRNRAMPQIDATYLRDSGPVAGFGYETRGLSRRHFMRWGASVKYLRREGVSKILPLTELVVADKNYLSRIKGGPASGWGGTIGFQYEVPVNNQNDFILASSWQDIGDTTFGNSLSDNPPPAIRNNLAAGGAFVHRFNPNVRSQSNIKITGEMRHLLERDRDPRLKMHFGAELSLGDLAIQGGYSQDSLTAGVKLDLWMLEIAAVTYGVEHQALAFMDRERRYMAQITFKFDMMGRKSRNAREDDRRKHPRSY